MGLDLRGPDIRLDPDNRHLIIEGDKKSFPISWLTFQNIALILSNAVIVLFNHIQGQGLYLWRFWTLGIANK